MEKMLKLQKMTLTIMLYFTTFVAIKNLFLFTFFAVRYYNTMEPTNILWSLIFLAASFFFLWFRNTTIKERVKFKEKYEEK